MTTGPSNAPFPHPAGSADRASRAGPAGSSRRLRQPLHRPDARPSGTRAARAAARLLLDCRSAPTSAPSSPSGSASSCSATRGSSWSWPRRSGVVVTQFGFLGHDAAHRQMFTSSTWNAWTARILAGGFAGLSFAWWRAKHNMHHKAPNLEGPTTPTSAPGRSRSPPASSPQRTTGFAGWFVQRQGWLFFPLLTLEGLNLHAESIRAGPRQDVGQPWRRTELWLVVTRLDGLRRGPADVPAAGQGGRVLRGPDGGLRLLPRRLVRAGPQGHADHPGRR